MNPPIYATPESIDENRPIVLRFGLHEAHLIWQAFDALGRQPPSFDCGHVLSKHRHLDLLTTLQRAVKEQYPDSFKDSPFEWGMPRPQPERWPKRKYPPGASHM